MWRDGSVQPNRLDDLLVPGGMSVGFLGEFRTPVMTNWTTLKSKLKCLGPDYCDL